MLDSFTWFFKRWGKNVGLWSFAKSAFTAFGVFWAIVDFAFYVTEQSKVWVIAHWWLFLVLGILWALYSCWPRDRFSYKLKNRDAVIEICVTDIFKLKSSVVIPFNTAFDAGLGGVTVRAQSVQGALLRKYYNGNLQVFEHDIEKQLIKLNPDSGKTLKQKPSRKKAFEIGTTITLSQKNRTFYLLASSTINSNGRAEGTIEELRISLDKLWEYIRDSSDKGNVVIPVLGTGHARLPLSREDAVRMIIRSYIRSCAQKTYCNKLTIAIHPKDVEMFKLDMNNLDSFLKFSCDYADFEESNFG